MKSPRLVVIADPESKRWSSYQRQLTAYGARRNVEIQVEVLPWRRVILRRGDLRGEPALSEPAIVRIESPGRAFEIKRCLLRVGSAEEGESDPDRWASLPEEQGRIIRPGLVARGLRRVLTGLSESLREMTHLRASACPDDISVMFDKNATSKRLAGAGISTPKTIPPPTDADELLRELARRRWAKTYVKLSHGSSAAGITVVEGARPPFAVTSMASCEGAFYNARQPERIDGPALLENLQFLLDEGAHIQKGVPMARVDGQNCDVRVVMIHGQPEFTIFRLSNKPMTNLHLGGSRGDSRECRELIPKRVWLDAMDQCVETASLFRSNVIGIDLVFDRDYLSHHLLELNPFGDFFHGTDERGRTVHGVEIERTFELYSTIPQVE